MAEGQTYGGEVIALAWNTDRKDRLPADWQSIRRRILRRDQYLCQWILPDDTQCLDSATDVDHIQRGDDHRDSNLRALCPMHHARKSASEGGQAKAAKIAANRQRFRRVERHPGLK